MRIISQDGKFDLPYESCVIWIDNKAGINVSPIGEPDSNYTFGVYSTPEKAEKAMQLLHEAYIVHENFKKLDAEIQIEVLKSAKRQLMYGGIFRFPKEEDL